MIAHDILHSDEFSSDYLERNQIMCKEHRDVLTDFFEDIPKDTSILEFGCNIGLKLEFLKQLGFTDLTGVELNAAITVKAKERNPDITFINDTIENFTSFKKYDLVMTSETLIYFSPENIDEICNMIQKFSKKYIFGKEFFSEKPMMKTHRNESLPFWTNDYLNKFKNTKVIRKDIITNPNGLKEQAYLLIKK